MLPLQERSALILLGNQAAIAKMQIYEIPTPGVFTRREYIKKS